MADADRGRTRVRRFFRQGSLGWYIFQNRNELQTDRVFAGLFMVIAIGLLVEVVVFRTLERVTVQRWGMQR